MEYIKKFENYNNQNSVLIVVDVQKSFRKYFNEKYLNELNKYCKNFNTVYQIWDNHIDGKNIDKDYLYDNDPDVPIHNDLYYFPNQKDLIEKRYNYNVDVDFYYKILDKQTFNKIKRLESSNLLRKGNMFKTSEDTAIVYIGNNHKWFHVPKKLYDIFLNLKDELVYIVGGSDSECLEDIFITAESMGLNIKRNNKYIYSANYCPF
jgi:hypothetical protein